MMNSISKENLNPPVIRLENLCKHYGEGATRVNAVNQVNLEIMAGEFSAIVGPSGSGKSSLLNLMSGLDVPDEGQVYLANRKISSMTGNELSDFRRDHIGFVFQAYNLIPVLTARENIEYIMLLQKVSERERMERTNAMLDAVGLAGLGDRFPGQLSGGQQQRVAIARAMVSRPKIILADEPTANLDSKTGAELVEMMRQLNQTEHMTFVFSTHDQHIMDQARRLIVLKDGKIERNEKRGT